MVMANALDTDVLQDGATLEGATPPEQDQSDGEWTMETLVAAVVDGVRPILDANYRGVQARLTAVEMIGQAVRDLMDNQSLSDAKVDRLLRDRLDPDEYQAVQAEAKAQIESAKKDRTIAALTEREKNRPQPTPEEARVAEEWNLIIKPSHRAKMNAANIPWTPEREQALAAISGKATRDDPKGWQVHNAGANKLIAKWAAEIDQSERPNPEVPSLRGGGAPRNDQDLVDRYSLGAEGGITPGSSEAQKAIELMTRKVNPVLPRLTSQRAR